MVNITCPICSVEFQARSKTRVYCSDRCRYRRGGLTCARCGGYMQKSRTSRPQGEAVCLPCRRVHGSPGLYSKGCRCDVCRAGQADRMRAYFQDYRDRHGKAWSTSYRKLQSEVLGYWPTRRNGISSATRALVYERDAGVCQICFTAVDRNSPPDSDWFPSLDHIEPRSAVLFANNSVGNLRLAHRWCNSVRRERIFGDAEVRARALEKREVEGGAVHGREEAAEAGEAGRESSTAVLLGVN